MSKRPSFQFYPADWSSNPNLKRCTFAEKGIWLEVMCLLHDQSEYGILRWSLQEIATAVKCRPADLRSLVRKGVMKGDDLTLAEPFIYIPRSGRKDGPSVTLVPVQDGPIWYSSRMVKDEYVRTLRGEAGGSNEGKKGTPEVSPEIAPKGGMGAGFGPRGSSSSSSSAEGSEDKSSGAGGAELSTDPDKATWDLALQVLGQQGRMAEPKARAFFGKLLRDNRLTAKELLPAVGGAFSNQTQDPAAYLTRAAAGVAKRRSETAQPSRQGFV